MLSKQPVDECAIPSAVGDNCRLSFSDFTLPHLFSPLAHRPDMPSTFPHGHSMFTVVESKIRKMSSQVSMDCYAWRFSPNWLSPEIKTVPLWVTEWDILHVMTPSACPEAIFISSSFVPAPHSSDSFRGSMCVCVCTGKLMHNRETADDP